MQIQNFFPKKNLKILFFEFVNFQICFELFSENILERTHSELKSFELQPIATITRSKNRLLRFNGKE